MFMFTYSIIVTQFELDWIRTNQEYMNFQFYLLRATVTLKVITVIKTVMKQ